MPVHQGIERRYNLRRGIREGVIGEGRGRIVECWYQNCPTSQASLPILPCSSSTTWCLSTYICRPWTALTHWQYITSSSCAAPNIRCINSTRQGFGEGRGPLHQKALNDETAREQLHKRRRHWRRKSPGRKRKPESARAANTRVVKREL